MIRVWLFAGAALASGCVDRDEQAARDHIAFEGMGTVEMLEHAGEGTYRFQSRTKLSICRGTVRIVRLSGRGTRIDTEVRCVPDEERCYRGAEAACMKLARIYERGMPGSIFPIHKDPAHALELYAHACRLGQPDACMAAGKHAAEGSGGAMDPRRATKLYGRACVTGSSDGCFEAARRHRRGTGTTPDPELAGHLLAQGCRLSTPDACRSATANP